MRWEETFGHIIGGALLLGTLFDTFVPTTWIDIRIQLLTSLLGGMAIAGWIRSTKTQRQEREDGLS